MNEPLIDHDDDPATLGEGLAALALTLLTLSALSWLVVNIIYQVTP